MAMTRLDRVAANRLKRPQPLDGNNKHATMSRGKPVYKYGSPNPTGTNQYRKSQLAKTAALKLRRR